MSLRHANDGMFAATMSVSASLPMNTSLEQNVLAIGKATALVNTVSITIQRVQQ
jgi:hypothetical protein